MEQQPGCCSDAVTNCETGFHKKKIEIFSSLYNSQNCTIYKEVWGSSFVQMKVTFFTYMCGFHQVLHFLSLHSLKSTQQVKHTKKLCCSLTNSQLTY